MTTFYCYDCSTDSAAYSSSADLEIHIANDHLNICLYECEKCKFAKFPTEHSLIMHYKHVHEMEDFYVRYRHTPEGKIRLDQLRERLALSIRLSEAKSPTDLPLFSAKMDDVLLGNFSQSSVPSLSSPECPERRSSLQGSVDDTTNELLSSIDRVIGEAENLVKKKKGLVSCQLCGLQVSNQRSSLIYHANTRHIKLTLYQCSVCNKVWHTIAKSDVVKHVKALHNGDESMVIDNRKSLAQDLRSFTLKCFPPDPSARKRPMSQGVSPDRTSSQSSSFESLPPQPSQSSSQQQQAPFVIPKLEEIDYDYAVENPFCEMARKLCS
ncbi:unnamed protein product [Auanema sp. JU1783]|nr:unnamed protein product [Auanema sp. JU1783]